MGGKFNFIGISLLQMEYSNPCGGGEYILRMPVFHVLLKPGVIDFHRFSFKIRRPTTGRFHPTSKLQTFWPRGPETPATESGFALMCW